MRISKIKPNDVVNGVGIMVSLWTQGCAHRCPGCFNKSTWSFDGGREAEDRDIENIINLLDADGVSRNLAILGGEPLAEQNIDGVIELCREVKKVRPSTKIFLWTGYLLEEIIDKYGLDVIKDIDTIIDGRFEIDKKDITLKLRGSSNQRIIKVKDLFK